MISLDEVLKASEGYLTKFPDGSQAAWKLLSIKQYEALRGLVASGFLSEAEARHEAFRLACIVPGDYYFDWPAGYVDGLGALILYFSGDCNADTLKNDLMQLKQSFSGNTVYERMIIVILAAYPSLTIDDVEQWSRPKLLKTFVRAEHSMQYKYGKSFEYMNVNDIKTSADVDKIGIDFEAELHQMREDGIRPDFWGEEETPKPGKLTAEQLRNLDRRR
jgi:hypothetical protein